jgi:hypothetical protein
MSNSQSFRLDASRWTRTDWITGISTLVLLITLFLPWFGVNILGISAQADGLDAHGYLYLALLLCLAIIGYLVAVAGVAGLGDRLPLPHRQWLLIGTGVNGLLILLAFAVKPSDTGWRFGAFAGLLAALVALAPQAFPALAARGHAAAVGTGPASGPAAGPDQIAGR